MLYVIDTHRPNVGKVFIGRINRKTAAETGAHSGDKMTTTESKQGDFQALTGKKKVLIIDDDRDYCQSVQALLREEGYDVICVNTGAEGVEAATARHPDLIILDVMMENMWAGYDVNQKLKFQSGEDSIRKVPIVMVSSIEEPPAARFARSPESVMITPDAYLTKPLDVRGFLDTVRSLTQK